MLREAFPFRLVRTQASPNSVGSRSYYVYSSLVTFLSQGVAFQSDFWCLPLYVHSLVFSQRLKKQGLELLLCGVSSSKMQIPAASASPPGQSVSSCPLSENSIVCTPLPKLGIWGVPLVESLNDRRALLVCFLSPRIQPCAASHFMSENNYFTCFIQSSSCICQNG